MSVPDIRFTGSIPENYDRFLGDVFFAPYARDLAARLPRGAKRVLELACGSGIVTRALRAALAPGATLVATDLSEGMVEYARAKLAPAAGIEFRAVDAQALPFGDGSFDAVACQFGMMFVPDKGAACREARRVLAPGGTLLVSTWDSFDFNPTSRVAHESVARLFPKDPPSFLTVPFGWHDERAIRAELAGAGFTDVRIERVTMEMRADSARELATGFVTGTPLANALKERGSVPLDQVIDAMAAAIAAAHGDHPVTAPMRALVITAVAPRPR